MIRVSSSSPLWSTTKTAALLRTMINNRQQLYCRSWFDSNEVFSSILISCILQSPPTMYQMRFGPVQRRTPWYVGAPLAIIATVRQWLYRIAFFLRCALLCEEKFLLSNVSKFTRLRSWVLITLSFFSLSRSHFFCFWSRFSFLLLCNRL